MSLKMIEKGITPKELGKILHRTTRQIYHYMSGKSTPRSKKLLLICKVLDIPIENISLEQAPAPGKDTGAQN